MIFVIGSPLVAGWQIYCDEVKVEAGSLIRRLLHF